MGESSDSVSIDIDMLPLGGKVRDTNFFFFYLLQCRIHSSLLACIFSLFLSLLTVCNV
jgi:hypothetical protein